MSIGTQICIFLITSGLPVESRNYAIKGVPGAKLRVALLTAPRLWTVQSLRICGALRLLSLRKANMNRLMQYSEIKVYNPCLFKNKYGGHAVWLHGVRHYRVVLCFIQRICFSCRALGGTINWQSRRYRGPWRYYPGVLVYRYFLGRERKFAKILKHFLFLRTFELLSVFKATATDNNNNKQ